MGFLLLVAYVHLFISYCICSQLGLLAADLDRQHLRIKTMKGFSPLLQRDIGFLKFFAQRYEKVATFVDENYAAGSRVSSTAGRTPQNLRSTRSLDNCQFSASDEVSNAITAFRSLLQFLGNDELNGHVAADSQANLKSFEPVFVDLELNGSAIKGLQRYYPAMLDAYKSVSLRQAAYIMTHKNRIAVVNTVFNRSHGQFPIVEAFYNLMSVFFEHSGSDMNGICSAVQSVKRKEESEFLGKLSTEISGLKLREFAMHLFKLHAALIKLLTFFEALSLRERELIYEIKQYNQWIPDATRDYEITRITEWRRDAVSDKVGLVIPKVASHLPAALRTVHTIIKSLIASLMASNNQMTITQHPLFKQFQ